MARHPNPLSIQQRKGADKKNPQRYRDEVPEGHGEFGPPPDHMTPEAAKVWRELSAVAIPGVLTASDHFMIEMLSNMFAQYRKNPDKFPAAKIEKMTGFLARMGMTPSDRRHLAKPPEKKKGAFDEY